MSNQVKLWMPSTSTSIPGTAKTPKALLQHAVHLSSKEASQIESAFRAESFEMMSGFVLRKAMAVLKKQLGELGMKFIGEMLGRPEINEESVPANAISDHQAVTLAQDLGMMSSTDAKRLKQSLELISHFEDLDPSESDDASMTRDEALVCLRACVQSVLALKNGNFPAQFIEFRKQLETRTFKADDDDVSMLAASPYFYRRTTLYILLSNTKEKTGAQLEHAIGNLNIILPLLWKDLRDPERWAIGQAFSEAVANGRSTAALGLKKSLLLVKGFDFVPESLRSATFTSAAAAVLRVHQSFQNFYNEEPAITALARLGSTFPWPAFPVCMSAVLAVFLGNAYGVARTAYPVATDMLNNVSENQWTYYVNNCLAQDTVILEKICWHEKPRKRWFDLVIDYKIARTNAKMKPLRDLISFSAAKDSVGAQRAAEKLLADRARS